MRRNFLMAVSIAICALWILPFESRGEQDIPSQELIQKGKDLFMNSKPLGVKYACILCHKGEKAIERAKVIKLGDQLPEVINRHIVEKSKGKPLSRDSQEMMALMAYIRHEHSK